MTREEIIGMFQDSGALLDGHFQLRSGLHSDRFFQAALLLQHPDLAAKACASLAENFKDKNIEAVISPAIGGLIVGHEVAKALGTRAIFAEKENDGMVLRRGFAIKPGERVLVAEDVVTRGGRVAQTMQLVRELGGEVAGVAVIVDRSGGDVDFGVPYHSLVELTLATHEPDACPLCAAGQTIDRPGSK